MPAMKPKRGRKSAPARRPTRRKTLPRGLRTALRLGAIAGLVAGAVAGGIWIWQSGTAARAYAATTSEVTALTARLGLSVRNVLVTGRQRAGRDEVARALGAHRGAPILAFDPHGAKKRLEALNWVRAATVERRLPDTIYLRLAEREPLALWQADGELALIDREGVVITREHLGRWAALPMIVGADAAPHAETIIETVRARAVVAEATEAMVRVSGRRWDLRLKGGVVAQLPEHGAARAVVQLADLIARERILERDVVAVDLRLPDRLVVRTRPGTRPRSGADAGARAKAGKDT